MTSGITYVIIAAVENYNESEDFPKVDFATKDAENIIDAFKHLGYEDFTIMLNEKATKTALIQKVKKISSLALENDRIIFYFAGHGFYEGGQNLLGCVDAIKTEKSETCVPINTILGHLNKSVSRHKILFLDCCHSGFEAGDYERDGLDNFMADELIYQFSKEEYCVGFSSCKSNQSSISHPKLKNGVWSHFLVKALKGEATGTYVKGLLFSDKLQAYLNKQTKEFVKLNTDKKKDQNPIKFGSETDKFIIADLNSLFDEKARSKVVSDISFVNVSLYSEEEGNVKSLPGFIRGSHKVPSYIGNSANSFIKDKGSKIVVDEISTISTELIRYLGYKRREIKAAADHGSGSITTPDFDYDVEIYQSETEPGQYIISRKIDNLKNQDIVEKNQFNTIFSNHFDRLLFELNGNIDIGDLIDNLEEEDIEGLTFRYDPSDLTKLSITIEGLDCEVIVSYDSISIKHDFKTTPLNLISEFKKTRSALMATNEFKLLE